MRTSVPATRRSRAADRTPGRPGEHPILSLSRAAGNQAVARMLARQPVATELLTPAQAAAAVSFYNGRRDLYPTGVVLKIQQAVHSPETGVADAAMAEAVAVWQSEHSLKVDGMAGPRTLPRMFESGLATKESREQFVETGKQVAADWVELGTAEERADKLFEGVETLLADAQVFVPEHGVDDLDGPAGVFAHKPWKITFDRAALSAASVTDEDARSVSGTVYHEARHAEQFHKMARALATKGHKPPAIKAKMEIPIEVAEDAFAKPLPKDVEFATASQQFDSVYGAGKAKHEHAERNAPTLDQLNAAKAAADANPALRPRYQQMLADFKAYHDDPVEKDAFDTETDYQADWDEKTFADSQ